MQKRLQDETDVKFLDRITPKFCQSRSELLELNWNAKGKVRELPPDWEEQGRDLFTRAVIIRQIFNIRQDFVINMDETAIKYSTSNNEKRNTTTLWAISFAGTLLKPICIWEGKTDRSCPQVIPGPTKKKDQVVIHTFQEGSHYVSTTVLKLFIDKVIYPHTKASNTLLIIDCCKVHFSQETMTLFANYPWLKVLYVPARCTPKLQPLDVKVFAPLKQHFRKVLVEGLIDVSFTQGPENARSAFWCKSKMHDALESCYDRFKDTTMLNKAWAEAKFCNQEGYGKPLTCGMTFKDAEDVMNRIHEIGPKLFPKWAQYAERHKTFFDKPGAKLPRAQTEDLFVTPTEEEPEDNNIMIDEE